MIKKFYKMHGLGNDFAIFKNFDSQINFSSEEIKGLASRKTGIGFDQLIIIESSNKADCFMHIFNSDGRKADACGNASRCVARLISEKLQKNEISIETTNRTLLCTKIKEDLFSVNMGIPFTNPINTSDLPSGYSTPYTINIGNPHLVFFVSDLDSIDLEQKYSSLENHTLFLPDGINVNVAEITNKNNIKLKTWERGAGATLACGTGACATAFTAVNHKLTDNNINVTMPGGRLKINITPKKEIIMIGDANLVFIGEFIK